MSKLELWWHPKCCRYFKRGTYFGGIVSTNIMLIENVSVKLTKLYGDWYSILENKTNEVIENVGCSGNRIKVSVGTKGVPVLRDWWIEGPEGYESFVVYWFSWLRIMGPLLSRCFYLFFLVMDYGSPVEQLCLLIWDYGSLVEQVCLFIFLG